MRRLCLVVGPVLFGLAVGPASAWCEKDCEGLCRATAGKSYSGTVQACVTHYQCRHYAGNACEPARMQARALQLNSGGGGGSGGGYQGCMNRGTRAGWGTAETAQYCARQGYSR